MIQFCPSHFKIKLVIKLNYNLYKHVKIIFNIFIDQITNYSFYFLFTCVKNFKCKKITSEKNVRNNIASLKNLLSIFELCQSLTRTRK